MYLSQRLSKLAASPLQNGSEILASLLTQSSRALTATTGTLRLRVRSVQLSDASSTTVGLYLSFRPTFFDRAVASTPLSGGDSGRLVIDFHARTGDVGGALPVEVWRARQSESRGLGDEFVGTAELAVSAADSASPSTAAIVQTLTGQELGSIEYTCSFARDDDGGVEPANADDLIEAAAPAPSLRLNISVKQIANVAKAPAGGALRLTYRLCEQAANSRLPPAAHGTASWEGGGEVQLPVTTAMLTSSLLHVYVSAEAAERGIGLAKADLAALTLGLDVIHGWYNILDEFGHVAGQVQLRIWVTGGAVTAPAPVPSSGEGASFSLGAANEFIETNSFASSSLQDHDAQERVPLQQTLLELAALNSALQRKLQSLDQSDDDVGSL